MDNLPFIKMHAQGNDYVYLDLIKSMLPVIDYQRLAVWASKRHFGIGADGLVLILPSKVADCQMRIFNADGSEAEMCGSALRCVCGYLYKKTGKNDFTVQTMVGQRQGTVVSEAVNPVIKVNMGTVKAIAPNRVDTIEGVKGVQVSAGNPHFVIFTPHASVEFIKIYGPMLESSSSFINGCNIHAAKLKDRQNLDLFIWERGSGQTLACGTGACAAVSAGIMLDLCDQNVNVNMPGGTVQVEVVENTYYLSGPVSTVFTGSINLTEQLWIR